MPVIFNATILNGMGVIGYVESPPTWHPSNDEGNLLSIHFTYSEVIWPWTGYLALHMQIKEEGSQFLERLKAVSLFRCTVFQVKERMAIG
jgi:membrane-bound transcription factor site-1 protease